MSRLMPSWTPEVGDRVDVDRRYLASDDPEDGWLRGTVERVYPHPSTDNFAVDLRFAPGDWFKGETLSCYVLACGVSRPLSVTDRLAELA